MNHVEILAQLIRPDQMEKFERVIFRVVASSFHDDVIRKEGRIPGEVRATESEVKRRTTICYKWFIAMRKDCGYGAVHAMDLLGTALRAELDGVPWVPPPANRSWAGQGETS